MSDHKNLEVIAQMVPQGARVLDLGCGTGELLAYLRERRGCTGYGVELDDVVLQLETLQHLRNAENMLRETARVGRMGIVSFPNFAHWPNRLSVVRGRMPVTKALPYEWYDTPNIRVGTYADFEVLAGKNGLDVIDSFGLQQGQVVRRWPNLMASVAVFKFQRR